MNSHHQPVSFLDVLDDDLAHDSSLEEASGTEMGVGLHLYAGLAYSNPKFRSRYYPGMARYEILVVP